VTDVYPTLSAAVGTQSVTQVSGKVTGVSGPVAGVTISTTVAYNPVTTSTASDGTYSLTVPRGDTYQITAEICVGPETPICTGQWFRDARDVVATGSAVSGVDFAIPAEVTPHIMATTPTIAGTPTLASTLSAVPGTWSPADVTFTYQWRRGGVAVAGATHATYTPTAADLAQTVTVVVTGSKVGYTPVSAESAASATIRSGESALAYEALVRAAYNDFLGRAPTAEQLQVTAENLANGTWTRSAVLNGLATSDEWLSVIVTRMYRDTLGRAPDAAGLTYWVGLLRTRQFTVAQVASLFYASPEYYERKQSSPTDWVTSLYAELLGRAPDPGGLSFWVARTTNPTYGRSWVAMSFYQSLESRMRRVQTLYQVLLKREPDPYGWPYWSEKVATTGDITLAVNLAESEEYWLQAHQRY
jgi:hypothetical protein